MSLFNSLQVAVSGVEAQSTQLGTIGNNIANATTTGYKTAAVDFQSLIGNEGTSDDQNGGVQADVRYSVSNQGAISSTSSTTDLAINGKGFFVVRAPDGSAALTRSGSFVSDANGNLVNAAGYMLLGNQGSGAPEPVTVPSNASGVSIGTDGTLSVLSPSGTSASTYKIPLGNVQSPDNMTALDGNAYAPNDSSGAITTGTPGVGTFGQIDSSSLEGSTVDLASQLSNLISTQSGYELNSKVMTTSSDMLTTLFQAAAG